MLFLGSLINAVGILLGACIGWRHPAGFSAERQRLFRVLITVAVIAAGLITTVQSMHGPFLSILKQVGIVLLSMTLGRLIGRILHLQKLSNRLGGFVRNRMAAIPPGGTGSARDGFAIGAALFCAGPLGILGAVQEGLSGVFVVLVIKAALDGLATLSFFSMFRWGIAASAIPVVAFQGTVTLLAFAAVPWLQGHGLVAPVLAVTGMLVFSVSLLVMEVRKIEVADYLPSLAVAPALAAWWGW